MGKQQSKGNSFFCKPLCLGQTLKDVGSTVSRRGHGAERTVDDSSTRSVPLLCLSGVVLVPGQTLPLHLFESSQASVIRRVIDSDNIFGIVTERFVNSTEGHVRSTIGTTVEITSWEEDSVTSSIRLKGVGSKRFQVISTQRQLDGTVMATVRLLSERELPPLLDGIMLASQRRHCLRVSEERSSGRNASHGHLTGKSRMDRFSAAAFTPWPSWLYKQFDERSVMMNIQKELDACNETLSRAGLCKEPTEYSFWLMANLTIDDQLKLSLLGIECTIQRLRCELGILRSCTLLCCKDCGLFIAQKKDVFSMSKDGPLGMYVNPGGYIHEMITVYRVDGLKTIGGPSIENTWFDGFSWTVVQCKNCTAHVGWKFTAVRRGLSPEKFWGICRSAVLPGIGQDSQPVETEMCHLTL